MRKSQSCGLQDSGTAAQGDPVTGRAKKCFSCSEAWERNKAFVLGGYKVLNGMGSLPLLKLLRVTCMEAAFFRGMGNNQRNKTSVSSQLTTCGQA